MFWSGNYIAVRELNSLLKEENVTLTQVLEADDVLQECKADNKALIQFLTRPDILAELITLITEEPSKSVELSLQYRHASIACEVLTSQLPTLADRLSMDSAQMHRLCDFINRDPPLNPLLASYFSKTIEMLLDRSPKTDWYLYHIVCLRVLDFLKARRDFLPNLLRHLHTSCVCDALRCFVRLNDLFNKIVIEWLEEHQFLESLIQIICGTYEPEPLAERQGARDGKDNSDGDSADNNDDAKPSEVPAEAPPDAAEAEGERARVQERICGVASANAATLLCDILLTGCAGEGAAIRPRTAVALVASATSARGVRALLQGMFTSPAAARRHALVNGARVLLAMRRAQPIDHDQASEEARSSVELAVAPHLPLLHTALLQPPPPHRHMPSSSEAPDGGGGVPTTTEPTATEQTDTQPPPTTEPTTETTASTETTSNTETTENAETTASKGATAEANSESTTARVTVITEVVGAPEATATTEVVGTEAAGEATKSADTEAVASDSTAAGAGDSATVAPPRAAVGAARLQVAALLAALCGSEVHEVASTMLTLGTPGVLLDMFFAHPDNNFLHAHVLSMLQNALANRAYRTQYARHILEECDLLNRLIDVYEENENRRGSARSPRSGYMGHALLMLRALAPQLEEGGAGAERWAAFSPRLLAALQRHDTPLGGYYPSENTYEIEGMVEVETALYNVGYIDIPTYNNENDNQDDAERSNFLELASQRMLDTCTWDDADEAGEEAEGEAEGEGEARGGAAAEGEAARVPSVGVEDVLGEASPWESASEESGAGGSGGEGWAQFSADAFGSPADPFAADPFAKADAFDNDPFAATAFAASDAFAPSDAFGSDAFATRDRREGDAFAKDVAGEGEEADDFTPFWGYQDKENETQSLEGGMHGLQLSKPLDELSSPLADNLRTAMSSLAPELVANIVNANMPPPASRGGGAGGEGGGASAGGEGTAGGAAES